MEGNKNKTMEGLRKEEIVKKCTEMLGDMTRDVTVPRNVRKRMNKLQDNLLNGDAPLAERATSAIYELEELANNQNVTSHTRTLVWNLMSQLETVSVE